MMVFHITVVIYTFGDSITYGAWDIEGGGWVDRLRNHLDLKMTKEQEKYYNLVYNLSIPRETTDGFVARFDNEVESREREGEEGIFIS